MCLCLILVCYLNMGQRLILDPNLLLLLLILRLTLNLYLLLCLVTQLNVLLKLTSCFLPYLLLSDLNLLIILLCWLEFLSDCLLVVHHFYLIIDLIVLLLLSKELVDALKKTHCLDLTLRISISRIDAALAKCKNLLRLRSIYILCDNSYILLIFIYYRRSHWFRIFLNQDHVLVLLHLILK